MKLTNTTVGDDAIRFVSQKSKVSSMANNDEDDNESHQSLSITKINVKNSKKRKQEK